MSNRFKKLLNKKLKNNTDFSPNFTTIKSHKFFNKIATSKMLINNKSYPNTYIILNNNEFEKKLNELDEHFYYIKPQYGEDCKNISFYHNKEFIIKKEIKFPLIIQREIIPKLSYGFKVDYRAYILYVKKNNEIKSYFFPYGLERKCKNKFNNNRSENNTYSITGEERNVVSLQSKAVINCLENAQKDIIPNLPSKNNKKIEFCLTGNDIIEDIEGKFWIIEINSKPSFFHRKNIKKMHKEILDDIKNFTEYNEFKKFIRV